MSLSTSPSNEIRVGISGGLTYNLHQGMVADQFIDTACPLIRTVPQWGYSIGVVGEYVVNSNFSLSSHLLYSTHPGSGAFPLTVGKVLVLSSDPNVSPQAIDQTVQVKGDIRYDLLGIDLMGKAKLLTVGDGGFGLAFGAALSHTRRLEEAYTQDIIQPENARFLGYPVSDTTIHRTEPVENASSTRFSLRGSLFYDLSLLGTLHITPGIYYDYGLTNLVTDHDWKMNAVFFQLDVTVGL